MLWVLTCTAHLIVCYHHVAYTYKNGSIFYSCSNVKKLLAENRREVSSLSDSNEIRNHSHLVRKTSIRPFSETGQILPVWLNGWMLIYKLSGCGFESRCCHLRKFYSFESTKDIFALLKTKIIRIDKLMPDSL